jgi:hypothetical protein
MADNEAVVEAGIYSDDVVELGGYKFVVTNGVRGQSASEFQTGLKIGAATYDSREHAFFLVLDDFTGGFGHRILDVRTALGTHFDNSGGVDLRRSRHITLPPLRTDIHVSSNPIGDMGLFFVEHTMLVSDISGAALLYFGVGNSIFTLEADRTTINHVADLSGFKRIHRLLEFRSSLDDATRAIYVFGYGDAGRGYYRSTDGSNFESVTVDGYTPHDFADGVVYDGNLVAFKDDGFAIEASGDGLNWTIDDLVDPHDIWKPVNYVQFIGVAMAPWGYGAPYFLDQGQLWVLNFYALKALRIEELGDDMFLHDGCVYNGQIYVTDGNNIWSYNPGTSETVRHLGPFGKEGVPKTWRDARWEIVSFMTGTSFLYAYCRRGDANLDHPERNTTRILVYTGIGWTWLGPETIADDPPNTFQGGTPYSGIVNQFALDFSLNAPVARAIDIIAAYQDSSTDMTLHSWAFPIAGDTPYWGSDALFENGPLDFETGWYDGGFAELEGVLLRMSIDAFHLTDTESVKIEYRLNNREQDEYELLGTFTTNHEHLWFTEDHRGLQFKTVQFRISLDRANDGYEDGYENTRTPELKSLILYWDKKSNLRMSWTCTVDVTRTVERGLAQNAREVWEHLVGVYNTKTLVPFTFKSLEPLSLNVRAASYVPNFQEIRLDDTAWGTVALTLLEPLSE